MTTETYAIYLTTEQNNVASGTVVNRVIWDGQSGWTPPANTAAVADLDDKYPLGSVYTASSST